MVCYSTPHLQQARARIPNAASYPPVAHSARGHLLSGMLHKPVARPARANAMTSSVQPSPLKRPIRHSISPTFTEDPFALEKATVVSKSILAPTQAVQAHVRVAPMQVAGRQSLTTDGIARTIRLTNGKPWTFDGVYGDRENNRHIFFKIGAPLVRAALEGSNATLIAHGQAGTGKTYSLHDVNRLHTSAEGLAPRMLRMLLERAHAAALAGSHQYQLSLQYLLVVGEVVHDLLASPTAARSMPTSDLAATDSWHMPPSVQLREDRRGVYAKDATWAPVASVSEMLSALERGGRTVEQMSARGSRGHVLIMIKVSRSAGADDAAADLGAKFELAAAESGMSAQQRSAGCAAQRPSGLVDAREPQHVHLGAQTAVLTLCDLASHDATNRRACSAHSAAHVAGNAHATAHTQGRRQGSAHASASASASSVNAGLLALTNTIRHLADRGPASARSPLAATASPRTSGTPAAKSSSAAEAAAAEAVAIKDRALPSPVDLSATPPVASDSAAAAHRDSSLTRLLRASLGGACKTAFLATVSRAVVDVAETRSTLQLVSRAREVRNPVELHRAAANLDMVDPALASMPPPQAGCHPAAIAIAPTPVADRPLIRPLPCHAPTKPLAEAAAEAAVFAAAAEAAAEAAMVAAAAEAFVAAKAALVAAAEPAPVIKRAAPTWARAGAGRGDGRHTIEAFDDCAAVHDVAIDEAATHQDVAVSALDVAGAGESVALVAPASSCAASLTTRSKGGLGGSSRRPLEALGGNACVGDASAAAARMRAYSAAHSAGYVGAYSIAADSQPHLPDAVSSSSPIPASASSPDVFAPATTSRCASAPAVTSTLMIRASPAVRADALAAAAAVAEAAEEAAEAAREAHLALAASAVSSSVASSRGHTESRELEGDREKESTLAHELAARGTPQRPASSQSDGSGVCHLLIKHGPPWRGSYSRVLKLTPTTLQTLSSAHEVTNEWAWSAVLGARRVPGRSREMEIHIANHVLPLGPSEPSSMLPPPQPTTGGGSAGWDDMGEMGGMRSLVEPSKPCLTEPLGVLLGAIGSMTWPTVMRFEAADEATATRVLLQVRRAAERGLFQDDRLSTVLV